MTEHPLVNSLIVENILKFSTMRDLPLHRLVCKTWFEVSLKRWRSTATLSILQKRIIRQLIRCQKGNPGPQIIKVLEETGIKLGELQKLLFGDEDEQLTCREFLQLDSKPFARYRLKQWTIQQTPDETDVPLPEPPLKRNLLDCKKQDFICGVDPFPQFWHTLGPLMQHLHLDKANFILNPLRFYGVDPTPLLLIIFHHTPNLQFLNLDQNKFNGRILLEPFQIDPKPRLTQLVFGSDFKITAKEFATLFPNLQNYTFKNCFSHSLFRTMSFLQNNGGNESKLPLRHLTIHHCEWSDILELGNELRDRQGYYKDDDVENRLLPLETLNVGTSTTLPYEVQNFVACLSYTLGAYASVSSLETLKISMSPFAEPTRQLLLSSTMYFVKHLELLGNCFASLSFLQWMPNLESLRVCISCFEKWQEIPELRVETTPMHQQFIKIFKDNMVHNAVMDDKKMKNFTAEKLKRFYIDYEFGLYSLETLVQCMPHLNDLQTILNNETLKLVCEQWTNLEKLELLYGSTVDDKGIVGSLNLMKNLRTFKLETYCDQSKLGNASATEGFLKMPQLRNLNICVSQEMTSDVERQLKKNILNATIIRNYGDHGKSHPTDEECCKRLQFMHKTVDCTKPPDNTKVDFRRSKRLN